MWIACTHFCENDAMLHMVNHTTAADSNLMDLITIESINEVIGKADS